MHVKSKNPRNYEFELNRKLGDSFGFRVRKIPTDVKTNAVIDEEDGDLIATADLMEKTGGEYLFLPGAEMDDMRTIVLPVNTTVALNAEMQIHNGTTNQYGKPDIDFISASTVVRIEP